MGLATRLRKLLGLTNLIARTLLKQPRDRSLVILREAIAPIADEGRPFDLADFRANDVREVRGEGEADQADKEETNPEGLLSL
jgi:hypothetical protein